MITTFQPWSRGGCTHPGCGSEKTATVDGHNGRRCDSHPPVFQPERAVALMVDGWPHTALAYVRQGPS